MINSKKFQEARVLLFDPVRTNLRVTRAALFEIGFRKIECILDFKDFSKHISQGSYDLVIAEVHKVGGDIAALMQKVRVGDVGVNPFVVAITTSWDRQVTSIQRLVSAGVDDLLLRPFSTVNLATRVHAVVTARKGFVVTGDYVGPDRRTSDGRKDSADIFHPPNTLKGSVDGGVDAQLENNAAIAAARQKMSRERIRTLAMRIIVTVELKLNDPETGENISPKEMNDLAYELRRRMHGHDAPDAIELCGALIEITAEAMEADGQTDKRLHLIKELAMGTYTAFADGASVERSSGEVDRTVNVLRGKLQEQSQQDWRPPQSCAT